MKSSIEKHFGLFMALAVIFGIIIGVGSFILLNYLFEKQYTYYAIYYAILFILILLIGLLIDLLRKGKDSKQVVSNNSPEKLIIEQRKEDNKEEPIQKQQEPEKVEPIETVEQKETKQPEKVEPIQKKLQPTENSVRIVPQTEIIEKKQIVKVKKVIGKDINDLVLKKMKEQEREKNNNI